MLMFVVLVVSTTALAQASWGVRAGVPVSPLLDAGAGARASTRRYTVGAAVEIGLGRRAGIGADFLLRSAALWRAAAPARAAVWRWEVPVTAVYRLPGLPARPFVRAGISLNRVFAVRGAAECGRGPSGERFYCVAGVPAAELRHRGTWGPVAGAGIELRLGRVRVQPEARLTRWADRNFGVRDAALRSPLSQFEVLAGVVF